MIDDKTGKDIEDGVRPVAWRDRQHTTWSLDESGRLTAVQGNRCLRFGMAEGIDNRRTVVRIRTEDGAFTFKKQLQPRRGRP